MIWYLSLAPKPMHPMLPRPSLLVINMRDSSILSKVNIQSAYQINLCPLLLMMRNAYLSGLKSLVTIIPGSITRVSLGRSVFAKVCT
jgi:hypothetical protein